MGREKKEMVKGNWTCNQCQGEIRELPFTPDPKRPVYCLECHSRRIRRRKRNFRK